VATLTITPRKTRAGTRYAVRYRLGGRAYPVQHGGSFRTLREARIRRDLIAGELAAGRNPAETLRARPAERKTVADVHETWLKAKRLKVSEGTLVNLAAHWLRLEPTFGCRDPESITFLDVQAWISEQEGTLTPAALRNYLGTLRQVLGYAGLNPNPARDERLSLPEGDEPEVTPPEAEHVLAFLERVKPERRLLFAFMERCGTRVTETCSWTWGDLDLESSRILSRPEAVKGRRGRRKARWVPVPEFLLNALLASTPPDDRDRDAPLFPWPHSTVSPAQAVHKAMERACKSAGIPHYHPHDLRHRRISLWHAQGVPAREIGDRVGQRQISTTLDTYTHVLAGAEIPDEALSALLVWSRCGLDTPAS
jgi:integrase